MQKVEWVRPKCLIKVEPPKRPKKITGTRFGAVLGVNRWSTPFEAWCAITRTYEEPFEDTIYTIAGKTIEPKQAQYVRDMGLDIITPTDRYGEDYFNKTRGDFFPDSKCFGGMWDYLGVDENGNVDTVYEMKTSKRVEDWQNDIPEYYALQAALYAYLMGVENVVMVASFLKDSDYQHPENYKCSVENTVTREFKVHERYPDFDEKVKTAEKWWKDHVETGISPEFDEKRDADILKALSTTTLSPDTDMKALIAEAEAIRKMLDEIAVQTGPMEKRLKEINTILKEDAINHFKECPGDKKVEMEGNAYIFTITKSETTSVDKDALSADGLLEKYSKTTETYKITAKEKK